MKPEGKTRSATIAAVPPHGAETVTRNEVVSHPKPSGRQHKSTQHGHSSVSHSKSHRAAHPHAAEDHVAGHEPGNAEEHVSAHNENHTHHKAENGEQVEDSSDDAGPGRRRRQMPTKRLNLVLTTKLYNEVADLAERQGKSVTEVLRIGLGLAHLAATQHSVGGRLAIVDQDGTMHYVIIPH